MSSQKPKYACFSVVSVLFLPHFFLSIEVFFFFFLVSHNRGIQIAKKEAKLFLFADDMILYTENLRKLTEKLSELINEFSKVAGYKAKKQKSIALLSACNKLSETEI